MNNIDYIVIQNFEWVEDQVLSFEILPTDELLSIGDDIRSKQGFNDESTNINNDVWYNFCLDVDVIKQTVTMWFTCNNGEKDDYANYDIPLTEKEKEQFISRKRRRSSLSGRRSGSTSRNRMML